MPFFVTMPKLSPTMEEGTIAKWHKKEGDFVEAGELLLEVATDKATIEYNALDEGFLRQILIGEGESASVNQPISIFTTEKNESIEGFLKKEPKVSVAAVAKEAPVASEKSQAAPVAMKTASFKPEAPIEDYEFDVPRGASHERVRASPLAKRLARERGLDLSSIKGSGPGHRVMERDLTKAQKEGVVTFSHHQLPAVKPGSYTEETLTPIRKVIAQRLQESKTFIPHFYVEQTVDAEPLVKIREEMKKFDVKATVNDLVIRASALALKEHPEINSGFNSETNSIIRFQTIDISIAVNLPEGLITPIIRHADFKTLGEISVEVKSLSARAKEGKLKTHEFKGGSFTISNLGMFGVTSFAAIINPPQAAILAVSGIKDVPVIKEDKVVPGKQMNLVLSVDHRVIDGVAAAEFLLTMKKFLENPSVLLI